MPAQPSARADQVDIVIAGGGPVGLMLACELRLSGTDPIVLERLPGINETPKGNGLVGQIVPMLDYRGLLDRLRQEATFAGPVPRFSFGPLQLDFSRLGTSPVHILTVPQRRLEKVLVSPPPHPPPPPTPPTPPHPHTQPPRRPVVPGQRKRRTREPADRGAEPSYPARGKPRTAEARQRVSQGRRAIPDAPVKPVPPPSPPASGTEEQAKCTAARSRTLSPAVTYSPRRDPRPVHRVATRVHHRAPDHRRQGHSGPIETSIGVVASESD